MSGKNKKTEEMYEMEKSSSEELMCTPPELRGAAETVSSDLLPSKSKKVYESAYTSFVNWRKKYKTKSASESVLMAYFKELSQKYKASTLWSIYSMLKSTISVKEKTDIGAYPILTAFLKRRSTGFVSKKSNVFSAEEVDKFLTEAPDDEYFATKVNIIEYTHYYTIICI